MPKLNLKIGIHAITLNSDHDDYLKVWIVGQTCDQILFYFYTEFIGYAIIKDDSIIKSYKSEQIEKVYYRDKTIEKYKGVIK